MIKKESQRKYWEKNRDEINRKARERHKRKTEEDKIKQREYSRQWYLRNKAKKSYPNLSPEQKFKKRIKARVNHKVKTGRLKRLDHCVVCRKKCKPEAHHEDYSKPFSITWVCKPCHAEIHRKYDWRTDQKYEEKPLDLDVTPHFYRRTCKGGKTHVYINPEGKKVKNCLVCKKPFGMTNEDRRAYYHKNKERIKVQRKARAERGT